MAVSFSNIPSNIRVPLFYAELDNSMAGTYQQTYRALLVGHSLTGTDANLPKLVTSEGAMLALAGEGSMLAAMYRAYRKNDTFTEVWALPITEDAAGVAATGTITVAGSALATGVLSIYIAGKLASVNVSTGDTAAAIAAEIVTVINADNSLPVTASVSAEKVTLTANWKGLTGNDIDLKLNYLGETGGEQTPTGVSLTFGAMSGGLLSPSIEDALANLGDDEFDYIALGFSDTKSLNVFQEFMNETAGRWAWNQQIYGHGFTAVRATVAEAQTLGSTRNDQHMSIMAYYGSPTSPWDVAAILTAQAAKSLSNDPARPLQTLPLTGMLAPDISDRFTLTERNTLLWNGISTFTVVSGQCQIERVITTYQKNAYGVVDNSYLDVMTLFTNAYIIRYIRQRITQKYGRHKLANDGTRFGSGQAIVTPGVLRAELVAAYTALETAGLVENITEFEENLIVERNADDPNRVDVVFPPDIVNPFTVFAMLNQFRLNY